MVNKKAFLSLILAGTLAATSLLSNPAGAVSFDSLDAKTSVAGSSVLLSKYMNVNPNAARDLAEALAPLGMVAGEVTEVAGENELDEQPTAAVIADEITYEAAEVGLANVEAFLNVREAATTLSDVIGRINRGEEIVVVGEVTVNDNKWFRINMGNDTEGYVSAAFVVFYEKADELIQKIEEEKKDPKELPTHFEILDDASKSVKKKLDAYIKEINYCLTLDLNYDGDEENYVGVYAIYMYLIENYQMVEDIATEYNLEKTLEQAKWDINALRLNMEALSSKTGKDHDDYVHEIVEESRKEDEAYQQSVAEEEKRRQEAAAAASKAEADKQAQRESEQASIAQGDRERGESELGNAIVDYAAQFVGVMPYVSGGSSLTTGADCSGFVAQIYAHFGLLDQNKANVHYYWSGNMPTECGYEVSVSEIQPGDLVCYVGHVAIYAGVINGRQMIIHSPNPGRKVEYGVLRLPNNPLICVRRLF